ncbi:hypothetical protein J008_05584 [Cryptococcus neoformans]|nr:hypothetical protein C362_05852 [Cryptococcus neoformans var. grubii Bt1]OXH24952.1 hypothetical protein J008_05584 [Cryptococcus neoformans var. grubii]
MVSSRKLFRKTLIAIKPSRSATPSPTTSPSTPTDPPVFPQEIFEQIISHLTDSPSALRAIALTCRALSPLALSPLWYQVPVGLQSKSPLKTHYLGPTTREIISLGLIKPPPFPNLSAELRGMTRVIDFYFRHFGWSLALYRREHRFLELFNKVKAIRIHLDSLCGYMSSTGVPSKFMDEDAGYENYAPRLPASEKVVFIGPCNYPYYESWFCSWKGHEWLSAKAPKKLVLLLKTNGHPISFRPGSFAASVLLSTSVPDLRDIVIIFHQGANRYKRLHTIEGNPWSQVRKEMVLLLAALRKKYPRTRMTLVNTGCFRATWLGFSKPVEEEEVQQKVMEGLKKVGAAKGIKLFGTFSKHPHPHSSRTIPGVKSLVEDGITMDENIRGKSARDGVGTSNAGNEKERLMSLSEYLKEEDWEGELDEREIGSWL